MPGVERAGEARHNVDEIFVLSCRHAGRNHSMGNRERIPCGNKVIGRFAGVPRLRAGTQFGEDIHQALLSG